MKNTLTMKLVYSYWSLNFWWRVAGLLCSRNLILFPEINSMSHSASVMTVWKLILWERKFTFSLLNANKYWLYLFSIGIIYLKIPFAWVGYWYCKKNKPINKNLIWKFSILCLLVSEKVNHFQVSTYFVNHQHN